MTTVGARTANANAAPRIAMILLIIPFGQRGLRLTGSRKRACYPQAELSSRLFSGARARRKQAATAVNKGVSSFFLVLP